MELRPPDAPDWVLLTAEPLPITDALAWSADPSCGGTVLFSGTVRDHAEGRRGVERLEYEAYPEGVTWAMNQLAAEARRRFPTLGRLALLHRVGSLSVGEVAVVVVAGAPHRAEAFEAARWCIDTLKVTVPIWKFESFADGADWSRCAEALPTGLAALAGARPGAAPEAPGREA